MNGPQDSPQRRDGPLSSVARRRLALVASGLLALAGLGAGAVLWHGAGGGSSSSPSQVSGQSVRAKQATHHAVRFTIEASGDLLVHSPVWERALALGGGSRYDFAPELARVKPYVKRADLSFCHVETPMTPAPPSSYPVFNTPPALAQGIRATGWDACDTASNHSLDQGQTGVDDTGKALDAAGIEHTGSFSAPDARRRILIQRVHGVKVAFLAYTTDTNGIPAPHPWSVNIASANRVLADAERAHELGADAVIVNVHWGGQIAPEYEAQPSPGQLQLVKTLLASRWITVVVGQGPHVVQPIEHLAGKFAVFSEGNLISNQGAVVGLPAPTQDGMIVLLRCVANGHVVRVRRVRYVPAYVNHPDLTVLPVGDGLEHGLGDAAALRASYQRTVGVVGVSRRIEPVPPRLPGG